MLLILLLALLAGAAMTGAWYGRLQERAWWTRRLIERGINPNTLTTRGAGMPREPLDPLDADTDAMREAMDDMAREVERLAEGQRFLTRVLTEKRALAEGNDDAPAASGTEPPAPPGSGPPSPPGPPPPR